MKGICGKCRKGAQQEVGTTVYCPHNSCGAILSNVGGNTGANFWLMYSPMPREVFESAVVAIQIGMPAIRKSVNDTLKVIQPKTDD